jgi:large subunit ribosomal protein L4
MKTTESVQIEVKDLSAKTVGKEAVDPAIFKTGKKAYLLHDYVVMQRRALRQGTHSTKTRAEVSGTGKKPFRQKGTGQARQGTLIGPHQPGGGIQFGPKPRCYSTSINKKTKREAIRTALSQKLFEKKLSIVDGFEIKSGKSKDAAKILNQFSKKSVLVVGDFSEPTFRSVRNLSSHKVIATVGINVFDLLYHDQVLLTRDALKTLSEKFKKSLKAKEVKSAA